MVWSPDCVLPSSWCWQPLVPVSRSIMTANGEAASPDQAQAEDFFGVLTARGSPKLGYLALKRAISSAAGSS
jgi:hypothetical protein